MIDTAATQDAQKDWLRLKQVGVVVTCLCIVFAALAVLTVPAIATADGGGSTPATVDTADGGDSTPATLEPSDSGSLTDEAVQATSSDPVANFTAKSTGNGFISFDENNYDDAVAEGLSFPGDSENEQPIIIEGQIYADGTWESTSVDFPVLNTKEDGSGLDAQATAPNGLQGEIDRESGSMTASGTLNIEIVASGDDFSFQVNMTTGESNGGASSDGLSGSASFSDNSGSANLVDNEYTVEETTGNDLIDMQLGLPIEDPGLAWLQLDLSVEITETAPATGTIQGTVEDTDGALEGATVNVLDTARQAQTDASGAFEIADIEEGTYELAVTKDQYKEQTVNATVSAGETTTKSIQLQPTEPDIGLELAAADTFITAGESIEITGTVTNDGGQSTSGTAELQIGTLGSVSETLQVPSGGSVELNETINTTASDDGEYVATLSFGDQTAETEFTVLPQSSDREAIATFSADNVGENGLMAFSTEDPIEVLAEGTYFPEGIHIEGIVYNDNTWDSTVVEIPRIDTADNDIKVDVTVPTGLSGDIIRDQDLMTATGEFNVSAVGSNATFSFVLEATTEGSGYFSETNGDFGSELYLVENEFTVDESSGNDFVDEALDLPADQPGENWFQLAIETQFSEDIGNIEGNVVDQNGDRVENATVDVAGQQTQTDVAGTFAFEAIETGTYDLTVDAPNADPVTRSVQIQSGTLQETIEVTRRGTFQGSVVTTDGEPIENATVAVAGTSTVTDGSGSFAIDVPEGANDVTVTAPNYEETNLSVQIEAGETTEQTVELAVLTGGIQGTLLTDGGEPVPGQTVTVEGTQTSVESGENGQFQIDGLDAGTTNLTIESDTFGEQTVAVTVEPGETTKTNITLEMTVGTVGGQVVSEEGEPVSGVNVSIEGTELAAATNADGQFAIENVPEGTQQLLVNGEGITKTTVEVEIVAGEAKQTEIRVSQGDSALELEIDAPTSATAGGTVNIGYAVTNPGSSTVDANATLDVGDLLAAETPLTVEPGETVTFGQSTGTSMDDEGTYTIELTVDGKTVESELAINPPSGEPVAKFTAKSIGNDDGSKGYVSFNKDTNEAAIEEGTLFPNKNDGEDPIIIEGYIYADGTWESTSVEFPTVTTASGFDVEVSLPAPLTGEIDRENDFMSIQGEFDATIQAEMNPTINFEINGGTGTSNALSGGASFSDTGGEIHVVDNEFLVPAETESAIINSALGLPSKEAGKNWFDLTLEMSIDEDVSPGGEATGNVTGVVEDENGDPIPGAKVNVEGAAGVDAVTNQDGSFEILNVATGTYNLTGEASEYKTTTSAIEIADSETVEKTLVLEQGGPNLQNAVQAADIVAGEPLEVIVAVGNNGTATATRDVTIQTGKSLSTVESSIEVGPQESTQLTDTVRTTEDDVGNYTVTVTIGDETVTTNVTIKEPKTEPEGDVQATFVAKNTGNGFISFGESTREVAVKEGLSFPEEGLEIHGEIYGDGTWQATQTEFPVLNVDEETEDGLKAKVEAPNGLRGKINPEKGLMTTSGTLQTTIQVEGNPTFQFDIAPITGTSNAMTGSAEFSEQSATVTLVDNEYIVNDKTGNGIIDGTLGLPILEEGKNWIELDLELAIDPSGTSSSGTVSGVVESSTGDPVEGATVNVEGIPQQAQTDASGEYTISDVPTGEIDLAVTAPDYPDDGATVEVSKDATVEQDFSLKQGTAEFDVEITSDVSDITPGENTTIEAKVTNTGDAAGSKEIELSVGGESQTESVDLAAGESQTLTMQWEASDGEYAASATVGENGASAERNLTVGESGATDGSDGDSADPDGQEVAQVEEEEEDDSGGNPMLMNVGLIFGLLGIGIGLSVGGLVVGRRAIDAIDPDPKS